MAKITWVIHNYPPHQNAGAEFMALEINEFLLQQGHIITVCATQGNPQIMQNNCPVNHTVNGIASTKNINIVTGSAVSLHIKDADIVITHLDEAKRATMIGSSLGKPVINIIHNTFNVPFLKHYLHNVTLVYNSVFTRDNTSYRNKGFIVHPPVNPYRFIGCNYNPNGPITLVNCNADKGAHIFKEIALSMPHRKFKAVDGFHGIQVDMSGIDNLESVQGEADIRKILNGVSVLLVPSIYESYGRIAVEAAACGIPVIASNVKGGVNEALMADGIYIERNNISDWVEAIQQVECNVQTATRMKNRASFNWERSLEELNSLNKAINLLALRSGNIMEI